MIVMNTNSTWPLRTLITPGLRQRVRKPMALSSASTRQCSTSSIALLSARRSIRPSPSCRPTSTPGWSNTTNSGPTRADTASAKHHFKPSLTPSQSPRKNPSSISRLNTLQPHDRRPTSSCRPSDQVQTSTRQVPDKAILLPTDKWLDVHRRDEPHLVPELFDGAPPIVRCRACLHGHNRARLGRQEVQKLTPRYLLAKHRSPLPRDAVQLEGSLCQ